MVEVWRRGWGIRPALTRSTPPPHAASRGGINATQMTAKPEVDGGQRGERETEQQACLLGVGLGGLEGGACHAAGLLGPQACRPRWRRIGRDRLPDEYRQGHGVGAA